MRHLARALSVAVTTAVVVGLVPGTAFASAPALQSTTPANRSYIKADPPTLSATFDQKLAPSSTLTVTGPSSVQCPATLSPDAMTLSCSPTTVPPGAWVDGVYTVAYAVTALSAPPNTLNGSFSFTLDKTPPTAPSVAVAPGQYTASDKAAGHSITVSGTSQSAGDSVAVALQSDKGGTAQATVTAGSGGAYSATFSSATVNTLADGTLTATATSTDLAGNPGPSASVSLTKDTVLPAVSSTVPVDGGAEKSQTGGSPSGYTVTASEALSPASTVMLKDSTGDALSAPTTVSGSTITVTPPSALPEGSYSVVISLVDQAGNAAPAVTRTFAIDDTAPLAPYLSSVTNPVNAGNVAAFTASGTAEPGATVTVTVTGTSGTPATGSGTASPTSGDFTVTLDAGGPSDGPLSVTATATDAASNTGPVSNTLTTSKDVMAPTVSGQAFDRSSYNSTQDDAATVTGSVGDGLGGPEGDAVQVSVDDTDASTPPVVATGTSDASTGAFTVTLDLSSLKDTTLTASVTATDDHGNASVPPATTTAAHHATAPTQPTVTVPTWVNASNQGGVGVSGSAPGATTVTVTITDSAAKQVAQTLPVNNGTFSYTFDLTGLNALVDGPLAVTAVSTDAYGNASMPGRATSTQDTQAPDAPSVVVPDYVTSSNMSAVLVSGTAEAGAVVTVMAHDSGSLTKASTTTALNDGTWSTTIDATSFGEGTVTFTVTARDPAGNTGVATTASSTKDTQAPSAATGVTTTPSEYLYADRDGTLTVTGSQADGDDTLVADVTISDGDPGTADLTATPPISNGSFSQIFSAADLGTLTDGTLTVTVVVRDPAGNTTAAPATTFVKDTTKLVLDGVTPVDGSRLQSANAIVASFNEALDHSASTIVVTNRLGNALAGTVAFSNADTTMTFTPGSALTEAGSPYQVSVNGVDAHDPNDTASGTSTLVIDTTAPAAPVVSAVTNPVTPGNANAFAASGTAEDGSLVTVTVTSGSSSVSGTATATGGSISLTGLDVSSLPDGALSVTATATDAAGNTSTASAVKPSTKDTTAPAAPQVTAVTNPVTPGNANAFAASGTAEAGSLVTVTVASGSKSVSGTATATGGAFSVTNLDVSSLPDGALSVTATATDAVGNTGLPSVAVTTSKDTVKPAAPVLTAVTNPVGSSNVKAFAASGTAEASSLVTVTVTSGAKSVSGTTTATGGAFSLTNLDISSLADGALSVTAAAADAAGNTSAASAAKPSTKDTTPPAVSALAATATSWGHPATTVTGSLSEAGTVVLTATDGTHTVSGPATVAPDRSFTGSLDLSTLAGGTISVTASATDVAGNAGKATATTAKDAATPPRSLTAPTVVAGDRSATVSFGTATSSGDAPVTGYTVTSSPGGLTASGTTSPIVVTGLTNGTAYTFTVTETNRVGSTTGAPSAAVTPMGTSVVSLKSLPSKVVSGTTVTLAGVVTRSDLSGAIGKVVVRVTYDNGSTSTLATLLPASSGAYAYTVTQRSNWTYRVLYLGDAKTKASPAVARRVLAAARVTASAPTGSHTVRAAVSGGVAPRKAGTFVYLYRVTSTGSLVRLAAARLSSFSTYRFSVLLPKGYTTLVVAIGPTTNNAAGSTRIRAYRR